jgi:hypothetical protein
MVHILREKTETIIIIYPPSVVISFIEVAMLVTAAVFELSPEICCFVGTLSPLISGLTILCRLLFCCNAVLCSGCCGHDLGKCSELILFLKFNVGVVTNDANFVAFVDLLFLGRLSQEFHPQHLIIFKRLRNFPLIILSI